MPCNLSKTKTMTQVHSGGDDKVVQDKGYFWNRVTGLDTHHQTAVLALNIRQCFCFLTTPNARCLSHSEAEVGVAAW